MREGQRGRWGLRVIGFQAEKMVTATSRGQREVPQCTGMLRIDPFHIAARFLIGGMPWNLSVPFYTCRKQVLHLNRLPVHGG
jgi:hypothetical protein